MIFLIKGLYSSPHIMEVRERIRINGEPLSKELFTKYFFETFEMFEKTKVNKIFCTNNSNNK